MLAALACMRDDGVELLADRGLPAAGPGQERHGQDRQGGEHDEAPLPVFNDDERREDWTQGAANLPAHLEDALSQSLPSAGGIPG